MNEITKKDFKESKPTGKGNFFKKMLKPAAYAASAIAVFGLGYFGVTNTQKIVNKINKIEEIENKINNIEEKIKEINDAINKLDKKTDDVIVRINKDEIAQLKVFLVEEKKSSRWWPWKWFTKPKVKEKIINSKKTNITKIKRH